MDSLKAFFGTPKKAFLFIVCVLAVLSAFIIGTTFAVTAIVNSSADNQGDKNSGHTVFNEEEIADVNEANDGSAQNRPKNSAGEDDKTVIKPESADIDDDTTAMISDGNDGGSSGQSGVNNLAMEVEEAKAIAVSHAGFSVADVSFSKAKLEKEHRMMVYEIEYYKDGLEYEYEINAETGEIIKYEMEEE